MVHLEYRQIILPFLPPCCLSLWKVFSPMRSDVKEFVSSARSENRTTVSWFSCQSLFLLNRPKIWFYLEDLRFPPWCFFFPAFHQSFCFPPENQYFKLKLWQMMCVRGVVKENKITPDDCAVTKHLPHGLMFKWKTSRPRRHKSARALLYVSL